MSTKEGKKDCSCNMSQKQRDYNGLVNNLGKRALKALGAGSGAKLFNGFLNYLFNKAGEMFDWIKAKNEGNHISLNSDNVSSLPLPQ